MRIFDKKVRILWLVIFVSVIIYIAIQDISPLGSLGTFFSAVWNRILETELHVERDLTKLIIYSWTRSNPKNEETMFIFQNISSHLPNFNRMKPTKVLFHGFSDHGKTGWILRFRDKYLGMSDVNVLSVEFHAMVRTPWYTTAAKLTRKVGEATAEMLEAGGVQPDLIHSIGVSLGAHGAASLGHRMGGRIRRLTGLDPAGPTFHGSTAINRFDKSAAHFVDVIHTAGKWVGNDDVLGHVDFFANTGRAPQPGCEMETVDLKCSHLRAWDLYLSTIDGQTEVIAQKCQDYNDFVNGRCCNNQIIDFGESVNMTDARGKFYFQTGASFPWVKPLPSCPDQF